MSEYNQEIIDLIRGTISPEYEVPTPVFTRLKGQFLDYLPNKSMECTFVAGKEFAGLSGDVDAGVVAAAVDQVFVAFAALTAGSLCRPVSLNTTSMRPIPADGKPFSVEARLRHRSKSIIAVDAKVINSAGKTAQTCTSTLLVSR